MGSVVGANKDGPRHRRGPFTFRYHHQPPTTDHRLRRFSLAQLFRLWPGVARTTRAEGDRHRAKSDLDGTLDDLLAVDALPLDESTVGRGQIDNVPDRAATDEGRVSAGDAVVGNPDVV